MDCYRHEGRAAVGCCRACLKGVCRECAVDIGGGLACRDDCEDAVRALVATIQLSVDQRAVSGGLLKSVRGLWTGLAWIALLVGLGVAALGFTLPYYRSISLLGIPFLLIGLLTLRVVRNVRRPDAS